jgi:hypothetical protein
VFFFEVGAIWFWVGVGVGKCIKTCGVFGFGFLVLGFWFLCVFVVCVLGQSGFGLCRMGFLFFGE